MIVDGRPGESVIVPPVSLHVSGLRHVAIDAFATGFRDLRRLITRQAGIRENTVGIVAENFVMAVADRIDDRRAVGSRTVTAQAKEVAGQFGFRGVRIMTIDAAHAFVVHSAAEKSCEFKILFAHLAIRIELLRLIHD